MPLDKKFGTRWTKKHAIPNFCTWPSAMIYRLTYAKKTKIQEKNSRTIGDFVSYEI